MACNLHVKDGEPLELGEGEEGPAVDDTFRALLEALAAEHERVCQERSLLMRRVSSSQRSSRQQSSNPSVPLGAMASSEGQMFIDDDVFPVGPLTSEMQNDMHFDASVHHASTVKRKMANKVKKFSQAALNWQRLTNMLTNCGGTYALRPVWHEDESGVASLVPSFAKNSTCASFNTTRDLAEADIVGAAMVELGLANTSAAFRATMATQLSRGFTGSVPLFTPAPDERRRQRFKRIFKTLVIHPHSFKLVCWVLLGLLFMTIDVFTLTMSVFGFEEGVLMRVVEVMASLYWSMDIVVSFLTAVFVDSVLCTSHRTIARQYMSTWFVFDLLMVALQWVLVSLDSIAKEGSWLKALRVSRFIRLLRLAKLDKLVANILHRVNSLVAILASRMLMYLFMVFLYVHLSGTIWYAIGKTTTDGSWLSEYRDQDSLPMNYFLSVHWAASQMQGSTDVYPSRSAFERAFVVVHVLASIVALATLVSKLTTVMHEIQVIKAQKNRQMTCARRYLEDHEISLGLSLEVRQYIQWKQVVDAKGHDRDEAEFLQVLPVDLRCRILKEARLPFLFPHPVFHACMKYNDAFFTKVCCDLMHPMSVLPDEEVFSMGMLCTSLYFVVGGTASYYRYSFIFRTFFQSAAAHSRKTNVPSAGHASELTDKLRKLSQKTLKEKTSLCEPALWVRWIHRGDLRGRSACALIQLVVKDFDLLLQNFPSMHAQLAAHANRFAQLINEEEDPSDLFGTRNLLQI